MLTACTSTFHTSMQLIHCTTTALEIMVSKDIQSDSNIEVTLVQITTVGQNEMEELLLQMPTSQLVMELRNLCVKHDVLVVANLVTDEIMLTAGSKIKCICVMKNNVYFNVLL